MYANWLTRFALSIASVAMIASLFVAAPCRAGITREEVERSIRDGVRFLKEQQNKDGSWTDLDEKTRTGMTSVVTLALLTAGEKPSSPEVRKALEFLHQSGGPEVLGSTYAIGLQTMVYALAEPERDQLKIAANVSWLERAQIQKIDRVPWPGSWSYSDTKRPQAGDNSNTQYALLGLHAASEVGVPVNPEVWKLARSYWESAQHFDGSFAYTPERGISTASMTCAGISSLVISGLRRFEGQEDVKNGEIHNCGKGGVNRNLQAGINWLAEHFQVGQNLGAGPIWKFYYLYGLERAGRLTGMRFFGSHDWYRLGAEELVHTQQPLSGFWEGTAIERNHVLSTSFALLFLAKGRAPVLINKLRHGPREDGNLRGRDLGSKDWNNDPDDIRNLVNIVSRDWKHLLTWQVVDPEIATVPELLQAPIIFFNGHHAPAFTANAKRNIREYIEEGGFLFAEACCGDPGAKFANGDPKPNPGEGFDLGFKDLMKEVFPEDEYRLRPLPEDHPVWRAKHLLSPEVHPLFGIEHGCRTVVIYSPKDLSCFWNQAEHSAAEPAVIKARMVGQNVIDYATGREMPADKLTVREVRGKIEAPKRDALKIAKLKHAGDWNIAPQAIPNLMDALRKPPYSRTVILKQKDLFPRDADLLYYPLIYIHGRAALSFGREDLEALRQHIDPGGGTLFADAACGAPAFDAAFRRFVAELLPNNPMVPIPRDDELMTKRIGVDLSKVQYTKAAGGGQDFPQLEGVKINDHWVIIYSRFDIGCALERHTGIECKGYTYDSAVKIAGNIVLYSMLP